MEPGTRSHPEPEGTGWERVLGTDTAPTAPGEQRYSLVSPAVPHWVNWVHCTG